MTDQKKTDGKNFHIIISRGDEIVLDTETDCIIGAIASKNENSEDGTFVEVLSNCNTITLIATILGAKKAVNEAEKSFGDKTFALLESLITEKEKNDDK